MECGRLLDACCSGATSEAVGRTSLARHRQLMSHGPVVVGD